MKIYKRVTVGGIPASLTSLATGISITKQANMIIGGGLTPAWYTSNGIIICGATIECNSEVIPCL